MIEDSGCPELLRSSEPQTPAGIKYGGPGIARLHLPIILTGPFLLHVRLLQYRISTGDLLLIFGAADECSPARPHSPLGDEKPGILLGNHAYAVMSEGMNMIKMPNREKSYVFELLFATALVTTSLLLNLQTVRADDVRSPQDKKPFTISIPRDVSVQLIGICSSPREGKQWWRPDGTPFEIEPCEGWSSSYAARWAENRSPERKMYEVALRITHGGAERATTKWRFTKGDQSFIDIGHSPRQDIRSVFVDDYTNAGAMDFKVAIAAGSWETDCTYPKAGYRVDFAPKESAGYAVIWQRPTIPEEKYPGRTKLNVIHDFTDEYETRVMLFDVYGFLRTPVQTKSNRVKNLTVFRGYYDETMDRIEEFRLQIRPLYWIQLQNVSLRQGFKTEPKIELCESADTGNQIDAGKKPRVIVSTDIGGSDPDDFQSMVHYLVCADAFETEGLISSPPRGGRVQDILECIAAYEKDYANLCTWSQDYPSPDVLHRLARQGAIAPQSGDQPSTKISEGAKLIIERAKVEDPRPLYVLVWGSITDVAQAVHEDPTIKTKLRIHSIGSWNTGQDPKARDYLYKNHRDLWWIESDSTFRGMYMGGVQNDDLGNRSFTEKHVKGHGHLGSLFMRKKADIKMGDTPSVLYMLHGDLDTPETAHWGGAFVRPQPDTRSTYWHDNPTESLSFNGKKGANTVNRWRKEYLLDWKARMDRVIIGN